MNTSPTAKLGLTLIAATVIFSFAPISRAQQSSGPNLNVSGNEMSERMELSNMDALGDKDEVAAYKAFSKEQDPAKKIQLGGKFLDKYSKGSLAEKVDVGMMNAYHSKQDWKNCYLFGANALVLQNTVEQ